MKEHHEATPQVKHPFPTTDGDNPLSPQNSKREPNREPIERSAFDNLLKLDEAFYRTESRLLAAIAARMRVPPSEIEDMVGEVWLSVVEHQDQLDGVEIKQRVCGLMSKVIHDKAVDLLRHLDSCPCQSLSGKEIEPIDDAAARRAEMAELREELEALLEKASLGNEENVLLLRAHFFQGLSIQELAEQFDITPDAVKGRIRRLEERMREFLEKNLSRKFKADFGFAAGEKKN